MLNNCKMSSFESLDGCVAVEVAVRSLEDDPVFNAGHGSVLNMAGEVEMDAIITDGSKELVCTPLDRLAILDLVNVTYIVHVCLLYS